MNLFPVVRRHTVFGDQVRLMVCADTVRKYQRTVQRFMIILKRFCLGNAGEPGDLREQYRKLVEDIESAECGELALKNILKKSSFGDARLLHRDMVCCLYLHSWRRRRKADPLCNRKRSDARDSSAETQCASYGRVRSLLCESQHKAQRGVAFYCRKNQRNG